MSELPVFLYGFAGAIPWLLVAGVMRFGIRPPRPLPGASAPGSLEDATLPSVTVIVPARNERRNIERCLRSISLQEHPDFRIVLVDDRSSDDTAALARSVAPGNARRIDIVEGEPLPAGWFGKPWACAQGARIADGELLLFTDADTWHHPSLLRRAISGMLEDEARALSLQGHQELGSFGERLVLPQILALLGLRYRNLDRPLDREDRDDAIANGQYILVSRDAYREIGGHAAVRAEVVEDLRLAQELVGSGCRLTLREAEDAFSTRMYRSLSELVDGWTKNLAVGARQSAGSWGTWAGAFALSGIIAFLAFWFLPAAVLAGLAAAAWGAGWEFALGGAWGAVLACSVVSGTVATVTWAGVYRRFGVSSVYGLLHPLGAALVMFIAVRSGLRGANRIEWKGRRYGGGAVRCR